MYTTNSLKEVKNLDLQKVHSLNDIVITKDHTLLSCCEGLSLYLYKRGNYTFVNFPITVVEKE